MSQESYHSISGDYDLSSSTQVFAKANTGSSDRSTFLRIEVGDGNRDLAAAADTELTIIVLRNGKFLTQVEHTVPQNYKTASVDTEPINWAVGETIAVLMSSDQAGDTDVAVTVSALAAEAEEADSSTETGITTDAILEAAAGPKRVTGDEGTVEERDIDDLIKADRYAAAKGIDGPPFGLRIAKLKFPGTT